MSSAPREPISWVRWLPTKPSQEQIVLLITVALLIVFSLTLSGFASVGNLLNLARSISILGILGLGMGLIVISRGIDLSEVAIMAGSWAVGLIEMQSGMPIFWAAVLALAVALAIGAVNGIMVAFVEAPALFVTLGRRLRDLRRGVLVRARLGGLCADERAGTPLPRRRAPVRRADADLRLSRSARIVVHLFLSRTSTGRFIYSQGDNPEAARLAGIALRPLIVLEYMIVAFLAWIAGLVWVGTTGSIQMAVVQGTYVFDVILVVVLGGISLIGGRGSVFSVVVGCALIGTLAQRLHHHGREQRSSEHHPRRGVCSPPSFSTTGCIRGTRRRRARATECRSGRKQPRTQY